VRRGVLEHFNLVAGPGNDFSLSHHHRTHGDFSSLVGFHGLPQSFTHEIMVAVQINDWIAGSVHKLFSSNG
jgi:hypothetical protein